MGQLSTQPLSDEQLGVLLNIPGCTDTRTRQVMQQVAGALKQAVPNNSIAIDPVTNNTYWNDNRTYAPVTQTQGDTVINEQGAPRPLLAMTLTSNMSGQTATASLTDYFGPSPADLNVSDTYNVYPYALAGDSGLFELSTDGQTLRPVFLNSRPWYSGKLNADWDGSTAVKVNTNRPFAGSPSTGGFFTPTVPGYGAAFDGGKKIASGTVVKIEWDFYGVPSGAGDGWYIDRAYGCPA